MKKQITKLERLQKINRSLITRIGLLSLNKRTNSDKIEIFEDRKFMIQKAMWSC